MQHKSFKHRFVTNCRLCACARTCATNSAVVALLKNFTPSHMTDKTDADVTVKLANQTVKLVAILVSQFLTAFKPIGVWRRLGTFPFGPPSWERHTGNRTRQWLAMTVSGCLAVASWSSMRECSCLAHARAWRMVLLQEPKSHASVNVTDNRLTPDPLYFSKSFFFQLLTITHRKLETRKRSYPKFFHASETDKNCRWRVSHFCSVGSFFFLSLWGTPPFLVRIFRASATCSPCSGGWTLASSWDYSCLETKRWPMSAYIVNYVSVNLKNGIERL